MLDPKLVARVKAFEQGQVQRCTTHRYVAVQPHALVLCPLAMAGEDTAVHAVAFGAIGEPPRILCVPDPRRRDDRYDLLCLLGYEFENYFSECREAETYPQIWVSSAAAATLLDVVAENARYARGTEGEERESQTRVDGVRRFGTLLSYFTDRHPFAGQQALLTATGALSEHFATGQDEVEDEHLGSVLCWMEPPEGRGLRAALLEAERVPMGVKTDPDFDKERLEPLVRAYNEDVRAGASARVLEMRAEEIRQALAPVAERIYEGTQRTIESLLEAEIPPLPALAQLEQREAEEFEGFMRSRDAGYYLTLRDRPKKAAFGLSAREDAQQNYEAALMTQDGVGRARGRLSGRVVRGRVENPYELRVGPRRRRYFFDLVSDQRVLRVRRRDELRLLDGRTFAAVVLGVTRETGATRISLELVKGMRVVGLPAAGELLELTSALPDWDRLWRERVHLSSRLAQTPWTHADERAAGGSASDIGAPSVRDRTMPSDPLAAVEDLR